MQENIGVEKSVRAERGCGDLSGGGTPVADNFAVQKDDRPEDAPVVMGLVAMVRVKDYLAAFVADQVFVEGGKKKDAPLPEHELDVEATLNKYLMEEKTESFFD